MSNTVDWVGLIFSWLPLLTFVGVWLYFMRRTTGADGYQSQILKEYRRNNEIMEKIIERMDQRIARLEERDAKSK